MSRIRLTALFFLGASTAFAQHAASLGYSSSLGSSSPSLFASGNSAGTPAQARGATTPSADYVGPFSRFALGAKVGSLGIGFQAATPLAARLNLSGGANFFSYNDNLTIDGLHYKANLHLRSAEASLDWFPLGGFHISPGALLYNGNQVTGNAAVPGGETFTLNDVNFNKAAPKLTVGFGNMLPRNGRHFSVPVELGFAYIGDPKVTLNLKGTACDPNGSGFCQSTTSPEIQANIAGQE